MWIAREKEDSDEYKWQTREEYESTDERCEDIYDESERSE